MEQTRGFRNRLAGQIGEYLVCAELGRRGYVATPFAGNVPTFDVVAADARCRTVPIQVKATRGTKWPTDARLWMELELDDEGIQRYHGPTKLPDPELIYVLVAIADPEDARQHDRFFVLRVADLQAVCIKVYTAWMELHGWRRPLNQESYDCRYSIANVARFEDRWEIITQRLDAADQTPASNLQDGVAEVTV